MKKNNPKIQKAVSLFVAAFFSSSAVSYAMTQTLRAPVTGQDGQGKENLRRSLIEEQAAQDEGNGGRVDANAELADLDYRRLLQRPREEVTREDLEALFASWKHSSGPVARLAVSEIVDDALGAKPVVVDFDGKTGQLTIRKSRTAKEGDILTALATQPGLPPYIQLPFRGAIESDTAPDGGVKQDPEQQLTELRAYLERLQTSLKRAEGETGADVIRTLTQDVDVTKEKIAALEAEIGSTAPDAARDGGPSVTALSEAEQTKISLVATLLEENRGAAMFQKGSIFAEALSQQSTTRFSIEGSVLANPVTRDEFEITLSLLEAKERQNPIWIATDDEKLAASFRGRRFVTVMTPEEYRTKLDLESGKVPIVAIGYEDQRERMADANTIFVGLRRPKQDEIVSAFGFMSIALSKDPALAKIAEQLRKVIQGMEATFKPTLTYVEAVTAFRQL